MKRSVLISSKKLKITRILNYQNTQEEFKSSGPIGVINNYFQNTINNSGLSNLAKKFLFNIGTIVDNYHGDTNTLDAKLISNYNNAYEKLNDQNEIYVIAIATIVAENSCAYWKKNMANWQQYLLRNSGITTKSSLNVQFSWGDVGKADVAGAVGGAVGSVVTGCAEVTLGACAGAGAAGGAVGGSVTSVLSQLL